MIERFIIRGKRIRIQKTPYLSVLFQNRPFKSILRAITGSKGINIPTRCLSCKLEESLLQIRNAGKLIYALPPLFCTLACTLFFLLIYLFFYYSYSCAVSSKHLHVGISIEVIIYLNNCVTTFFSGSISKLLV